MKRSFIILLMIFSTLSLSAVAPYDERGERIVIDYQEESDHAALYKALKEEVDLEWYEKYSSADSLLVSQTFETLKQILPLDDFVFTEEKNDAIGVLLKGNAEKDAIFRMCGVDRAEASKPLIGNSIAS